MKNFFTSISMRKLNCSQLYAPNCSFSWFITDSDFVSDFMINFAQKLQPNRLNVNFLFPKVGTHVDFICKTKKSILFIFIRYSIKLIIGTLKIVLILIQNKCLCEVLLLFCDVCSYLSLTIQVECLLLLSPSGKINLKLFHKFIDIFSLWVDSHFAVLPN